MSACQLRGSQQPIHVQDLESRLPRSTSKSRSPLTSASALPATASSRNARSSGSRHAGTRSPRAGTRTLSHHGRYSASRASRSSASRPNFRIGQRAGQLGGGCGRGQGQHAPRLPQAANQAGAAAGEDQRREHYVGVQHDPQGTLHRRGLRGARRAHATAAATSSSRTPSSASFARTAPARCTRTGVSTMRPSFASTSKYSASPTAAVIRLGSVELVLGGELGEHGWCAERK